MLAPGKLEKQRREQGFTLLELLVVLGILALASVFVAPLVSRHSPDLALAATARKLANDMRMARASAIRRNVQRTLTIDLKQRRFWVDGVTAASTIAPGIAVDFVTLRNEQMSSGRGRVRFFPDGSSTGGNVILSAGGRSVAVDLDWMTGRASVKRNSSR